MNGNDILKIVEKMGPTQAASEVAMAVKKVFRLLDEDARLKFVVDLFEETPEDKGASLVHL